jgi:hypothetical protein
MHRGLRICFWGTRGMLHPALSFSMKILPHLYLITIPLSLRPSMVCTSRAHSGPLT